MIYNSNEPRKIGATYMTYNNTFYSVVNEEISKIVKEHGDQLITLDSAMSLKKERTNSIFNGSTSGCFSDYAS